MCLSPHAVLFRVCLGGGACVLSLSRARARVRACVRACVCRADGCQIEARRSQPTSVTWAVVVSVYRLMQIHLPPLSVQSTSCSAAAVPAPALNPPPRGGAGHRTTHRGGGGGVAGVGMEKVAAVQALLPSPLTHTHTSPQLPLPTCVCPTHHCTHTQTNTHTHTHIHTHYLSHALAHTHSEN